MIDVQKGINDNTWYGGPNGRRNNSDAEANISSLLTKWRQSDRQVAFTKHDSRKEGSPLRLSLESVQQLDGMETEPGDIVVEKDVNSTRHDGTDNSLDPSPEFPPPRGESLWLIALLPNLGPPEAGFFRLCHDDGLVTPSG